MTPIKESFFMGELTIPNLVGTFNTLLQERYLQERPVCLDARGVRPRLLIHSLEPLSYESLGRFSKTRLHGNVALRGMLYREHTANAEVYYAFGAVEAGRSIYGIPVRLSLLKDIGAELEREDLTRYLELA